MSRVDKYIWAVRLCKTRSVASSLVKSNKVMVNGEEIKPSKIIKIGDQISVKKNAAIFTYKVLELLDKRVGAKLVADYIEDITPDKEIEKFKIYQLAQKGYRESGFRKPTKKDIRAINKFLKK